MQNVFTINYKEDSVSAEYKLVNSTQRPISAKSVKTKMIAQELLDRLVTNGLLTLKDDSYRSLDVYFLFFEIAPIKIYKVLNFWSPDKDKIEENKAVCNFLNIIEGNLDNFNLETI